MKAILGVLLFAIAACDSANAMDSQAAGSTHWKSLVQSTSAEAFRGWKSADFPKGWKVDHGTLSKDGPVDDLVTRQEYANFEFELDWKIGEAGNSGVLYRGTREYDHIYWSAPEYQLLDDANAPDGRNRLTAAGAAYGLYPAPVGVVHAAGQWNTTRILVNGTHVEHWLNGQKIVEYELGNPDWQAKKAASKFASYEHYGTAKQGYISIQGDHPGDLTLRNMRIRKLP